MSFVQKFGKGILPHWSKWAQDAKEMLWIVSTFSPKEFPLPICLTRAEASRESSYPHCQRVNTLWVSLAQILEMLLPCNACVLSSLCQLLATCEALLRSLLSTFKMFGMSFWLRLVFWTGCIEGPCWLWQLWGCPSSRLHPLLWSPAPVQQSVQ